MTQGQVASENQAGSQGQAVSKGQATFRGQAVKKRLLLTMYSMHISCLFCFVFIL